MQESDGITYEPNDRCPIGLSVAVGFQGAVLALTPTALATLLFAHAAGLGERYVTWSVLVSIVICGIATALQATRLGWLGGGHVLIAGAAPSYMAVALLALDQAGPATLASLIVAASLFQLALARWLPLLRRIITPMVSGTVLMLIAAGVMQIAVARLADGPDGTLALAAPAVAAVTVAATAMLGLRAAGRLRLWTPLLGILAGCVAAALLGLYDAQRVLDAPWIGWPDPVLPGVDLTPGPEFWSLLPMFLIVAMASAIKALGSNVAMQRVSWREPRVTDYRLVQGTVNANAASSLLGGLAGVLPTAGFATTVTLASLTGVAARRIGYYIGVMLVALALLPKVVALLLTIPNAVTSGYMLVIMGVLFVEGLRSVFQDGLAPRKVLIVGTSLAIGIGLQGNSLIQDQIGGAWGTLLGDGMTVGTITAIALTSFSELSSPRRRRLEVDLEMSALPKIDAFLKALAERIGWDEAAANRLRIVGEEALASLLEVEDAEGSRRLTVLARPGAGLVELEFMAALPEENLQDRLAYLSEHAEAPEASEVSLRLLRHFASAVHHRKYHGIDIVTVEVRQ